MPTAFAAYKEFIKQVRKVPLLTELSWIHEQLDVLAATGYMDPQHPWLVANELSALAKSLVVDGTPQAHKHSFDPTKPLNRYKDFWSAAEKENPDTGDPAYIALFVLRFAYSQAPFLVFPARIQQSIERTRSLYISIEQVSPPVPPALSLAAQFQNTNSLELQTFLSMAYETYKSFKRNVTRTEDELVATLGGAVDLQTLKRFLSILAADRERFTEMARITESPKLHLKPYEFNPLLRFPILQLNDRLWCPFPELVIYAATRGLFFYFSDILGSTFNIRFGELFSSLTEKMTRQKFKSGTVLKEEQEKALGWNGKTNDVTVILGEHALLFECKTSALFACAKQSASVEDVRKDVVKNIVGHKGKKGLLQLLAKIEAIRSGKLPSGLAHHYAGVKNFYPILLFYDQVQFANKPETLKRLLDDELSQSGTILHPYQIWHLEELENLYELIPEDQVIARVAEKFATSRHSQWDLNVFLFDKTGRARNYLRPSLFIPKGDTPALKTLSELADKESAGPTSAL
jgi:hypothetical protein